MSAVLAILALLILLALAVYIVVILALRLASLQHELGALDELLAAKDARIELLERHRAIVQAAIIHYITLLPKANKSHARRQAAERCMN